MKNSRAPYRSQVKGPDRAAWPSAHRTEHEGLHGEQRGARAQRGVHLELVAAGAPSEVFCRTPSLVERHDLAAPGGRGDPVVLPQPLQERAGVAEVDLAPPRRRPSASPRAG
ncbi:hypothetical protein [Streptomyces sp. KL116D]|uniref:hypothetical protein n=1 Tax=Streptomyces sp. KL116D TaxID=3045152 RepID=UPI0035575AF7